MTKRSVFAAVLILALARPALAGQPRTAPPPSPAPAPRAPQPPAAAQPAPAPAVPPMAALDERGARDTRQWLNKVLEQYPPSVRDVLRIDPSLLSRPEYLATYPTLAAFLEQHPEVAHNPAYFVGTADNRQDLGPQNVQIESVRMFGRILEMIPVVAIVFIITSALAGVLKTLLDQHRWKRAVQMQMDMQNKLVDRFAGSNDLLAYLQSPAGRGLNDIQAPMMAFPAARGMDAPISRIFWPLQAGIVLTAAGIGLHFFGARMGFFEVSQAVSGLGALVVAIGLGFIVSAIASYLLSHRLGLIAPIQPPDYHRATPGA